MRNREVRLYCLAMAAVALVVTGMVYQWAPQAVPAFLCGFGALCLLSAHRDLQSGDAPFGAKGSNEPRKTGIG